MPMPVLCRALTRMFSPSWPNPAKLYGLVRGLNAPAYQAHALRHQKLGRAENHVLVFNGTRPGNDCECLWPKRRLRHRNNRVGRVHFPADEFVRLRDADQLLNAWQQSQLPRISRFNVAGHANGHARRTGQEVGFQSNTFDQFHDALHLLLRRTG